MKTPRTLQEAGLTGRITGERYHEYLADKARKNRSEILSSIIGGILGAALVFIMCWV